jgi:hypothetical protein
MLSSQNRSLIYMKVKENLKSLLAAVSILMVGVSGPLEAQNVSVAYYGENGNIVDLDPLQIARLDCPQAIIGEGGDIICPTVGSGESTLGDMTTVTYYGENGDIVDLDPLQIARLDCPQAIIGEGGDIVCLTVGSGESTLGGMTNIQVASADQEVNLILNAIESLKVCLSVQSEPTEPSEPSEPSEIGATFTAPEVNAGCVVDISVTNQQVAEIMADAYLMISDIYREKAQ